MLSEEAGEGTQEVEEEILCGRGEEGLDKALLPPSFLPSL